MTSIKVNDYYLNLKKKLYDANYDIIINRGALNAQYIISIMYYRRFFI